MPRSTPTGTVTASGPNAPRAALATARKLFANPISPSTPASTKSSVLFNHYSLLMTTESLLHWSALGLAAKAPNMLSTFNL